MLCHIFASIHPSIPFPRLLIKGPCPRKDQIHTQPGPTLFSFYPYSTTTAKTISIFSCLFVMSLSLLTRMNAAKRTTILFIMSSYETGKPETYPGSKTALLFLDY
jgi:hypothetical protein